MIEGPIATLHINGSAGRGRIAGAMVEAASKTLGLDNEGAAQLDLAVAAVVRAVDQRGFDDPEDAAVDVSVLRRGRSIVVQVDDLGLPFDYTDRDGADGDVIGDALDEGWVDEISHAFRGRDGNRTELVRAVHPGTDVRDDADLAEHEAAHAAPRASEEDARAVVTRLGGPDDAVAIARLTWRTYGYSYQHTEYYQPERLADLMGSGLQCSFVCVVPSGEVVGHSAVLFDEPGAAVAEGGRAMVDPRYRGHGLLHRERELRTSYLTENRVAGMMSDAVTAHTRSQEGGDEHTTAGVLLAFLPPTVDFRGLGGSAASGRREAVVMNYHVIIPHEPALVHAPVLDEEIVRRVYEHLQVDRTIAAVTTHAAPHEDQSQIDLEVSRDLGTARIKVGRIGTDFASAVRDRVRSVHEAGIQAVYVELRLTDPVTPWAAEQLTRQRFFFGGVVPLLARGHDVVRYQHIGDAAVVRDDIQLASDFAADLLDHILTRRAAVSGA